MGGFHLFADVAKYGRTFNRPVERFGDGKPIVGSNFQSVSINENVFQSFNSYAKAVLGNKSVDMLGKYGASNAEAESGFDDVGLRYVGGRWVWLEFDSMDQVESVKTSKALNEIFMEFKDVSHNFIPDERCVWIDVVGLPLASWALE
nr:armadillo-type fold protein [Tanacetum cinerariifolium]